MTTIIAKIVFPVMVFAAGGGPSHTHGEGGETEHLYPVLIVFAVLLLGGAAFHLISKKK